ncbi:MAG: hypothetical protein Q8Q60_00465 [Candidatus Chromulinivorax sp.]|nr:hypothetical protein [Candidatus Chromulinivorax sp.]
MKNKFILWIIFNFVFCASLSDCSSKKDAEKALSDKLEKLEPLVTLAAKGPYNNPEMLQIIQTLNDTQKELKQFPEFNNERKVVKAELKKIKRVNNQKNPNSSCALS